MSAGSTRNTAAVCAMILVCTIIVVGGALIRIAALSEPLWLDELHTSWCVSSGLGGVASRAAIGNQSPLYFWIVYPVYQLLGENEISLRLVSLVGSLLLLVSLPIVTFRLTKSLPACAVVALLAAVDDSFVYYAVEARPYVLVQLVAVWQFYFFVHLLISRLHRNARRDQIGFVIFSWALFYLHYTAILFLAAELTCVAIGCLLWATLSRGQSQNSEFRIDRRLAIAGWIAVVGMVPGLWHLVSIAAAGHEWSAMIFGSGYVAKAIAEWVIYLGIPITVLMFFAKRGRDTDGPRNKPAMKVLVVAACCAMIPVFAAVAADVFEITSVTIYRFTIASSTIAIFCVGLIVAHLPSATSKWIALTVLLLVSTVTNPF